tara:strand:- start:523 stop:738 length:216 start_codon:yes stop_codon:yes gene_type:complete
MSNQVSRSLLLRSVLIIKQWHDIPEQNPDTMMFKIYYNNSPEMKEIREVLGTYDEIKDEVIECNSISVNEK